MEFRRRAPLDFRVEISPLIDHIQAEDIQVLLAATYFSHSQVETIAERTGCRPVQVPLGTGIQGADDYFQLVDLWVDRLAAAFGGSSN